MISWQVYIFGDRCTDDITPNKILVCSHIKQIDSTLQWVCTVVDRRWCQNVVVRASFTNLAPPQVPLFLFLPHLMLSVIFYWTDSQQHGIFLLISKVLQSLGLGSNKLFPLPKDLDSSRYATNLRKHVAFFKNMFRQFFSHLQFWFILSTRLNLKCKTKCWLDKTNNRNKTMYAITRKVSNANLKKSLIFLNYLI